MLVTWSCLSVQSAWEKAKTKSRKNIWMSFDVPRNSVQCTLERKTSKIQTWRAVCDPRTTHASIFVFCRKPFPSSFHTSFRCIASILGVTPLTRFRRSGQRASAPTFSPDAYAGIEVSDSSNANDDDGDDDDTLACCWGVRQASNQTNRLDLGKRGIDPLDSRVRDAPLPPPSPPHTPPPPPPPHHWAIPGWWGWFESQELKDVWLLMVVSGKVLSADVPPVCLVLNLSTCQM